MIKKIYRLNEEQVKKVLKYSKPFFSYWIVLYKKANNLNNNRYSIIISWKNVVNNVSRNYFRRKFFSLCFDFINNMQGQDCIFVVKKQIKLDKSQDESIQSFQKDIKFLLKKISHN